MALSMNTVISITLKKYTNFFLILQKVTKIIICSYTKTTNIFYPSHRERLTTARMYYLHAWGCVTKNSKCSYLQTRNNLHPAYYYYIKQSARGKLARLAVVSQQRTHYILATSIAIKPADNLRKFRKRTPQPIREPSKTSNHSRQGAPYLTPQRHRNLSPLHYFQEYCLMNIKRQQQAREWVHQR